MALYILLLKIWQNYINLPLGSPFVFISVCLSPLPPLSLPASLSPVNLPLGGMDLYNFV